MSSTNNIRLEIFNANATCDRILNNRQVGLFTSMTCAKYFDPYVPMQSGMLSTNVDITKPFKITYNQPYAHYQYEGICIVCEEPLNYTKDGELHPLATSHWDVAAYEAHQDTICRQISNYIKRLDG